MSSLQQSNFFAVLEDTEALQGADHAAKAIEKKKELLRRRQRKQEAGQVSVSPWYKKSQSKSNGCGNSETKTAKTTTVRKTRVAKDPERSMKAKPLVLPEHVLQKEFVLRRNYPKRIEAAFDQVKKVQVFNGKKHDSDDEESKEEDVEKVPRTFTLEEYEKMKLEKVAALGLNNKKTADDQQRRTVDLEKAFGSSMTLVGKKKEEIMINFNLKSEKAKTKIDNKNKKKVSKSNRSIDNFLKTMEPAQNSVADGDAHHSNLNCEVLEKQSTLQAKPATSFGNPAKFWGKLKLHN